MNGCIFLGGKNLTERDNLEIWMYSRWPYTTVFILSDSCRLSWAGIAQSV